MWEDRGADWGMEAALSQGSSHYQGPKDAPCSQTGWASVSLRDAEEDDEEHGEELGGSVWTKVRDCPSTGRSWAYSSKRQMASIRCLLCMGHDPQDTLDSEAHLSTVTSTPQVTSQQGAEQLGTDSGLQGWD